MTDNTELKRLAEAAPGGPWVSENDSLYFKDGGYTRHLLDADAGHDVEPEAYYAALQFIAAANPAAVLALIAENEQLAKTADCWDRLNIQNKALSDSFRNERDQLRAEVAGLRTGYEAYERVNAELKAENEALRRERDARHPFKPFHEPAIGFTGCVICGVYTDHGGLPCPKTRATADAAMGKGEQS